MDKYIFGSTFKFTWVSSGITPSSITAKVYNGDNTVVSSVAMTSSGNGHYYSNVTVPTTPGFYVKEVLATVSGDDYKEREKFKVILCEVD